MQKYHKHTQKINDQPEKHLECILLTNDYFFQYIKSSLNLKRNRNTNSHLKIGL